MMVQHRYLAWLFGVMCLPTGACESFPAARRLSPGIRVLLGSASRVLVGELRVASDHFLSVDHWAVAVGGNGIGVSAAEVDRVRALHGLRVVVGVWDSMSTDLPFVVASTRDVLCVGLEQDLQHCVATLEKVQNESCWLRRAMAMEQGRWAAFAQTVGANGDDSKRRDITGDINGLIAEVGIQGVLRDIAGWYARTAAKDLVVWSHVRVDFDDRLFFKSSDRMIARAIAEKALGVDLFRAGITLCDGYSSARRLWVLIEYVTRVNS